MSDITNPLIRACSNCGTKEPIPEDINWCYVCVETDGVTNKQVNDIARMCHQANRTWCLANGDDSQPNWHDAPDWQCDSARKGVRFHLAHPDAGPSHSHEEWMRVKLEEGWVYGETKDPEAKTHPCIVPYEELPLVQRMKDHVFRGIVHSMREGYGVDNG